MIPDEQLSEGQVLIRKAWRAKRPSKGLTQFINILTGKAQWETYLYVAAYSRDRKIGGEDFTKIVRSKEFSGPHHSPYFVMHSDTELLLARFMVRELSVWDFRTAKRLKKP